MILLQLFWEYFKVGLFSVGGGMATIPFLYDMSDKTGWFTHSQLLDMLAVSESTPGPIGINMATYVGYTTAGVTGSVIATVAVCMPSVIIALLIARVLAQFRHNRHVEAAFYGLRPASAGLIGAAGAVIVMASLIDKAAFAASGNIADLFHIPACILALAVLVLTNFVKPTKKLHPIIFIAASAVIGVIFRLAGA